MTIAVWDKEVDTTGEGEIAEEVTFALLQMSPEDLKRRWEGKIICGPNGWRAELRNSHGDANILVIIGMPKKPLNYWDKRRLNENPDKNVWISMNSTAQLSVQELAVMTLAIKEAKIVVQNAKG